MLRESVLATAGALLLACAPSSPGESPGDAPPLATFGDLSVSAADLDTRLLGLPPTQRPRPGEDLDAWYTEQIEELVVERALEAEARAGQLESTERFRASRLQAEHLAGVRLCLRETGAVPPPPTEEEIREAWEAMETDIPESRAVQQIYLRGDQADAVRRRAEELRSRVLGGENFGRLAREESDSESRHREGFIGWIREGQLPGPFDRLIFALEEGVPSEPLVTGDGAHLFFVQQIQQARQVSLDEVRGTLRSRLSAERQESALEDFVADLESSPVESIPRSAFDEALSTDDIDAVVLTAPDRSLALGDISDLLVAAPATEGSRGQRLWKLLQETDRLERIYHHCADDGDLPQDEMSRALAGWERSALVQMERYERLLELTLRDEPRLRSFHQANLGQFSSAPTWTLRELVIPLGATANETMATLERALDGETTLEGLQQEQGGEIEELGRGDMTRWRQVDPRLPALLARVEPGGLVPPYRTGRTVHLVEVLERSAPVASDFEAVRDQVAAAYVTRHRADLYQDLRAEILAEHELDIDPEVLAEVRSAGMPPADISAEELEALLDEL